jgi:hypothetical protein
MPTDRSTSTSPSYLDPGAATRRYNAMVEADATRTWAHLGSRVWFAIAERLSSVGILRCTGSCRTFCMDRANDAYGRAQLAQARGR